MNNNCKMLHETYIKDIIDVIGSVKDMDRIDWIRRGSTGSLARRSSNLVLVFPVLISSQLSISTANIIAKAIERKCVSLLQILFSAINLTTAEDLYEYVAQFHHNLGGRMTLDDFINAVDKLSESGNIDIIDRDLYNAVKEDMHNINYYLSEAFNPTSINDYKLRTDYFGNTNILCEADRNEGNRDASRYKGNHFWADSNPHVYSPGSNDYSAGGRDYRTTNHITVNGAGGSLSLPGMGGDGGGNSDFKDFYRNQLLPQDVQKANELMPTMVAVKFTSYNNNGLKHTQTGVIGVKAKLYPVDSMDIINRLSSKYKDKNGLFNLIRASTREISFFKDLAFAIDKAKLDAVSMSKESNNAKMFKLLERRAAKNRFSSLLKKNDASPITSLVISQGEVEYLQRYNNLDMEKSYVTRVILEAYNLMDIVIADESLEIARFLFDDGDGIYETLPFDALEKEAKDNTYKKVINLMSKVNN